MRRLFFHALFLLLAFTACRQAVPEMRPKSASFLQDSALIAGVFAEQLQKPEPDTASLWAVGKVALADPGLEDLYVYNLARLYVVKGRFAEADSVATVGLKNLGSDTGVHRAAKYYNLQASILLYAAKPDSAIVFLQRAQRIYDGVGDEQQSAAVTLNIASTFFSLQNFPEAYYWGRRADAALTRLDDTLYLPVSKGITAIAASVLNKLDTAALYARAGLALSEAYNSAQGLVLARYALGEVAAGKKEYPKAIAYYKSSREVAAKIGQPQLLLINDAALLKNLVLSGQYAQGSQTGKGALEMARAVGNHDIEYSLLKNLAAAEAGRGNHRLAYTFMQQAEKNYREREIGGSDKIVQELLLKYETEKKNNQILIQKATLAQRDRWIAVLVAGVLLLVGLVLFVRNVARSRARLARQHAKGEIADAMAEGEEQERHRIAGELHDGVASSLTALRYHLKDASPDATALLHHTQQDLRAIAHRLAPIDFSATTLPEVLEDFCHKCSTSQTAVHFITNAGKGMGAQSAAVSQVLYRAAQELIQNALKHGRPTEVAVQLLLSGTAGQRLSVEDNGQGFVLATNTGGLSSLRRRVASVGGSLHIESEPGGGAAIFINV